MTKTMTKTDFEAAALAEIDNQTREYHFTGAADFGRVRASGSTSADAMWEQLLTTGRADVSLQAEINRLRKTAAGTVDEKSIPTSAKNMIGQRVVQPFQVWYADAGKGTGVFEWEVQGSGARARYVGTHVDPSRPPKLISNAGRVTKVGKIAAKLYANGLREFACGVSVDDVAEVVAILDAKSK